MKTLEDGTPITLDMAREVLAANPPGQGVLNMEIHQIFIAPFVIAHLLERVEEAEKPCWRKAVARIQAWVRWAPARTNVVPAQPLSVAG